MPTLEELVQELIANIQTKAPNVQLRPTILVWNTDVEKRVTAMWSNGPYHIDLTLKPDHKVTYFCANKRTGVQYTAVQDLVEEVPEAFLLWLGEIDEAHG